MYFSFSQSTQLQPYSLIYLNYDGNMTPSRFFSLSHAGMDPIRSINYEIGLQLELLAGLGLDINAYYRDIENYGIRTFEVTQVDGPLPAGYFIRTGAGYADSRGIELTLTKRPGRITDWLVASGRISYTYSYIKEAIYAGGNRTSFTGPGDRERLDGQLPFEDLRRYNSYERNVITNNSVLTGGYDRPHRVTVSALFGFPYDIQFSVFGRAMSGFYYPLTLEDPRARALGVGPSAYRFDMRFDKLFRLNPVQLRLFVDITNAFDNKNIMTYNRTDAAGGQRLWEEEGDPTGPLGRVVTPDGSHVYEMPREVRMGLQVEF
jgi:outer membrane receptor protein involved in Fe transport